VACENEWSVNAAHAVNGDFLYEELFRDDCFGGVGLDVGEVLDVVLFHTYDSTRREPH